MKACHVYLHSIGGRAIFAVAVFMATSLGAYAVDPLTLSLVKELPGIGGERMLAQGNRLFVQGDSSLTIYDASDPANPQLLETLALPTKAVGMQASMTASDTLLALAAYPTSENVQRVYLVDITTPATPAIQNSWSVNVSSMLLDGPYLYLTAPATNTFQIHDVSNPAAPQAVFNAPQRALPLEGGGTSTDTWFAEGVAISGHYAFTRFGSGRQENTGKVLLPLLVSWDITNPAATAEVSALTIPTTKIYYHPSCAISGTTAFFGCFFFDATPESKGGTTLDVTNPAVPAFLADMDWEALDVGTSGTSLYAAPVAADQCVLMALENGLAFVDLSVPATPYVKGTGATTLNDALFLGNYIAALLPDKLVLYRKPGVGSTFDAYSVVPAEVGLSAAATFTVQGNGFAAGTTAVLTNGTDTLNAASVNIAAGGASLTAVFDLSAASPGGWQLRVTAPGETPQNLSVTVVPGPSITVSGSTPDTATAWGKATLTVTGDHFGADMTAQLKRGRMAALNAESVLVGADGKSATVVFDVTGAYPGPRTLVLSRPGMTSGELPNAIDLVSALQLASVMPTTVLANQDFTLTVTGAGFLPSDTLRLSGSGSPTIGGTTVASDGGSLTATCRFSSGQAGVWGAQIVRSTGEAVSLRRALTVFDPQAGGLAVWPTSFSGLAEQAPLTIVSAMLQQGAQPEIRSGSVTVAASAITPSGSTQIGATFPIGPVVPLGAASLCLVHDNVIVESQPVRILGAFFNVQSSGPQSIRVFGEGFVDGCSAWIDEVDTGQHLEATEITGTNEYGLNAAFAVVIPNGVWRLSVQGPNGRVISTSGTVSSSRSLTGGNLVVGSGIGQLSTRTGGQGGKLTLLMTGKDFTPVQSVQLVKGGTTIDGTDVVDLVVSGAEQSSQVQFDLATAEKGVYDVIVTTAGGAQHRLVGGFQVIDAAPQISVSLDLPEKSRVGRSAKGSVRVQNTGNVDAIGFVLLKGLPPKGIVTFPQLSTEAPDAVVVQPEVTGDASTAQLGELSVPAGQTRKVSLEVKMNQVSTVEMTPQWIGVHQN